MADTGLRALRNRMTGLLASRIKEARNHSFRGEEGESGPGPSHKQNIREVQIDVS